MALMVKLGLIKPPEENSSKKRKPIKPKDPPRDVTPSRKSKRIESRGSTTSSAPLSPLGMVTRVSQISKFFGPTVFCVLLNPRSNIQIWRTFSYSRIVLIKQGKPIIEVQTLIKICQLKTRFPNLKWPNGPELSATPTQLL